MPIREYVVEDAARGCVFCQGGFERMEPAACPPFPVCPECGAKVLRRPSAPRVGASKSTADDRAKEAGFVKLRRLGKGEYEQEF